jgi:hypothetical protein
LNVNSKVEAGVGPAVSRSPVRDGNLITGQQNFSGAETARFKIEQKCSLEIYFGPKSPRKQVRLE